MFRKLLKYDLKAIYRIWCIMAAVLMGVTLLSSLCLRISVDKMFNAGEEVGALTAIFFLFSVLTFIVYMAVLSISSAATTLLNCLRFYQNCYTDQGYLTFTLPDTRRQLLLSKTVNAVIWQTAQILLIFLSLGIFFLIFWPAIAGAGVPFPQLGQLFSMLQISGGWFVAYLPTLLLCAVAASVYSISFLFLCITLGSVIFKKHKLIGAVGVYLGFNFVISIASSVFSLFGASALTSGIQQLLWNASPNAAAGVICLLLLAYAVIMATVGITFYLITPTLIDRKLNWA